MGMERKAIIFDFFGVISSEVAPFWFQEHMPGAEGRKLEEEYVRPADRGEVSQEVLLEKLGEVVGISSKDIESDWLSRAHINGEVVAFIKELRGTYRIGLLTNAFSPFFATVFERAGIQDLFEVVVMSNEEGHVKPEPEMYLSILEKMGLQPQEALMVDDNPINVEGAKKVGMEGIVFTSVEQLRKDVHE